MSEIKYFTPEGLQKLKDELDDLILRERPRIVLAIQEARDKGDLSENAEYDAAKEAQGLLEAKIAELQEMSVGVNVIENEIRKAVGMPLLPIEEKPIEGHWCEMIVHARPGQEGEFECMDIRDDIKKKNVRVIDMSTKPGDYVHPFTGANMALGDMFLQFDTREALNESIEDTQRWLDIVLKSK
jgi:hypothetical protein